ncbi:MAG: peroxidase-related enzyme [Devosia sp.]|uniref:peroxidase-related enzyme n=1 Tax=Devosia sp. TaxID=1871048 RepID=UPI001A40D7D1|nr:peroxidase-related enzyme [Devosia sp.]MBL8600248.1 peroxidase-related enzyme [Devosia sp.]
MRDTKQSMALPKPRTLMWLDLEPATPTSDLQKVFDATKERIGYVRNSQLAMAGMPDVVIALDGLSRSVMRDGAGTLSAKERELIALVASVENSCVSCTFTHAARLRSITADPMWTAIVEANYRHAELSDRERAIADYAYKLTAHPAQVDESDLAPLRTCGVSEEDIFYVVAITSYFNLSNRLMSGLGMKPNREAYEAGR